MRAAPNAQHPLLAEDARREGRITVYHMPPSEPDGLVSASVATHGSYAGAISRRHAGVLDSSQGEDDLPQGAAYGAAWQRGGDAMQWARPGQPSGTQGFPDERRRRASEKMRSSGYIAAWKQIQQHDIERRQRLVHILAL